MGIGNALVDVLSHEDEAFLDAHGLVKGSMTLVDTERAEALYAAMGRAIEASGGSAANTISGIASFGGRAAFIGRVFDDQLGTVFAHDLRAIGAAFRCAPATEGPPTGRCLIVVTPDAERTMNTYLGASEFLGPEDVDGDLVAAAQVTYLEGYLFDRPEAQEAYWKASRIAHDAGRRVSLTLSDTFCVERHSEAWRTPGRRPGRHPLRQRGRGDGALRGRLRRRRARAREGRRRDRRRHLRRRRARSSCTTGDVIEVPAHPVERVVDTTGAGDLYAAGFLFGFTAGRPLDVVRPARLDGGHRRARPHRHRAPACRSPQLARGRRPVTDPDPWALVGGAATAIAERTGVERHDVLVVLGSGWTPAADRFGDDDRRGADRRAARVPRRRGWPATPARCARSTPTAAGAILVLLGRVHAYEGHDLAAVVHAVRAAVRGGLRDGRASPTPPAGCARACTWASRC